MQHIFSGAGAPTSTPTQVGHHYIDTTNDKSYISVGTSASSDWQLQWGDVVVDTGSYGSPQTVAGSGVLTFPTNQRSRIYLKSTGGAVTGVTPPASGSGTKEIYILGVSDTDTVQMVSSTNLLLSGTIVFKLGTMLYLQEVPGLAKWVEVSRNEI
jgi:hypothetical protein